jgi:hypothetical protein
MSPRRLTSLLIALAAVALVGLTAFVFSGGANASWSHRISHDMMRNPGYVNGMMHGYGTTRGAYLVIRHQRAHCHAWSLNGGPYTAAQHLTLSAGAKLTVVNNDVMPHRLVKTSGPSVTMLNGTLMPMMGGGYVSQTPGLMSHMGARTTVKFSAPGSYVFHTHAGEDYMPGIETTGSDNALTLTVSVT